MITCYRCGTGAFQNVNVNTNLKKVTAHRDGFRDQRLYVHANAGVCNVVIMTKRDQARKAERERRWWRRAWRRLRGRTG